MSTKWNKEAIDNTLVKEIAQRYRISLLEASVLVRRGLSRGEDILFFLEQDFVYLHNPFLFKDMELAIDRIQSAQADGEKILVYGDKDVDGITSTTILVRSFVEFGIETLWRVPTGTLGYGLSREDIDYAASEGVTLVVTVDCGISNIDECEYALEKGIDLIVCDHHMPGATLPSATAIIDAKVESEKYPFDSLCAAAVAQKLRVALVISQTSVYNRDIVLLNVIPLNNSYKIEMISVRNLAVQWRKSMTISSEDASYQADELIQLLDGKEIVVYNQALQNNLLQEVMGNIEIYSLDLKSSVDKHFSKLQGKSLLQISETVRLTRYLDHAMEEIDILFELYKVVVYEEFPQIKQSFYEVSDLVAIATIADMMPLVGENRIFFKIGVQKLNTNPNSNLEALMTLLKVKTDDIVDSKTIGWKIAPTINSAGRMGQANIAVEMLLAESTEIIEERARQLLSLNNQRKKQMDSLKNQIREDVEKDLEKNKSFALVFNDDLPHSFTGIVAGQYSRQYGVPIVIIAKREDGVLNGSIRCPASFNAPAVIQHLRSYLIDGGGHKAAAGFSLLEKNKERFTEELIELLISGSAEFDKDDVVPTFVDLEIPNAYFNPSDMKALHQKFEPYGEGWGIINTLFSDVSIHSCETVGKDGEHLKITAQMGKYRVPVFLWQFKEAGAVEEEFFAAKKISFVATIKIGSFQGIENFSLVMQNWEFM